MSKTKTPPERISNEAEPDDDVRLKPFLGMRPGQYLACLYGFVLLLILFFVFLYPGIANPGAVMVIKSEPWGAAVRIDGAYMEAAPCEIFVPAGRHRIEISLPGFLPKAIEIEAGSRLFGSLFFPLKIEISEKLETIDPSLAFINEAEEYAAWTFAGEPSAAYQIPQALSEAAYRFGPEAADPAVRKAMNDTITVSAGFAVTRAALRDLVRAKTLLDNQGLSPSPLSLLDSAAEMISFLEQNPGAAFALADVLTGEERSVVTGSAWYNDSASSYSGSGETYLPDRTQPPSGIADTIQAGFLTFRRIQGGALPAGGNFPPGTVVDTFYISETVINARAWDAFLEAEPRWRRENLDALIREGLVSGDYLDSSLEVQGAPAEGVSGISWHSAQAFCAWLTRALPPQFGSWEARLPLEEEWEYAARVPPSPIFFDFGRFWEWCNEPFIPLRFLSVPRDTQWLSPERLLKGGSWINPAGSVQIETRASLPPSFCSPFVSARLVIAPKRTSP